MGLFTMWWVFALVFAAIGAFLMIMLIDEFPDPEDFFGYCGVLLVASCLWFICVPLIGIAYTGYVLRIKYRTRFVKWFNNLFEDDEDEEEEEEDE